MLFFTLKKEVWNKLYIFSKFYYEMPSHDQTCGGGTVIAHTWEMCTVVRLMLLLRRIKFV